MSRRAALGLQLAISPIAPACGSRIAKKAWSRRIVMILACSIRSPASRPLGGSSSLLFSRPVSLARVFCAAEEPAASSRAFLPPWLDRPGCLLVTAPCARARDRRFRGKRSGLLVSPQR